MQRTARVTRACVRTSGQGAAVPASPVTRCRLAPSRPSAKDRRILEARCRSIFTTVVALLIALTSVGLARVAVIARAAEMTISADSLSRRIKDQRVETDQLEMDRSSLTAPSRIEGIAADTMSMGDPASVSYIVMPEGPDSRTRYATDSAQARSEAGSTPDRFASVISALLDVSAGEAQSLLVGDLGLAGSR